MAKYMNHGGRAVEIYRKADGQEVPRLLLNDVGEELGDAEAKWGEARRLTSLSSR
jgi:hypothetical protein